MRKKYVMNRLFMAIPTFLGITLLVFFLASLAPGSPLDAFLSNPGITEAELKRLEVSLGLDRPLPIQYCHWMSNLLRGDLGYSFSSQRPVMEMIGERLGPTLLLTVSAIFLSGIIAIPFGILSAARPKSGRDYAGSILSFLMMAFPNFFVGLILIYVISVKCRLLPSGGMYDSVGDKNFLMLLRHMILPCIVLSFQQIGIWYRQMRGSLIEVMQEDYIRMARAKGLREWDVVVRYGLKNAFIPVLTVMSMSVPGLVSGAVVTEQLFGWQGLGTLMIRAISARDYPVIMGTTVVVAIIVFGVNLATDLVYSILDPRICDK